MSSIYDSESRPAEDLTARARIRDAAMAQFAEHGYKDTTIKGVAAAAGVSTGLVQHHFGSKEALRAACDQAVVEVVRQKMQLVEGLDRGEPPTPGVIAALYERSPLLVRYLIRLLTEGSPAVASLFDEFVAGTEKFLSDVAPEVFPPGSREAGDGAAVLLGLNLGAVVLHEQLARRLGVSIFDRSSGPRIGLVLLDIYEAMGQWAASGPGIQARSAVAAYLQSLAPPPAGCDKEHDDE